MTPVERIIACGFRVYMRSPRDEYCYYTDGERIAYAQWPRGVESVGTVHIPNKITGTGYVYANAITDATIRDALACHSPHWAAANDRAATHKWKNWDAFAAASEFNREFIQVTAP